MSEDDTFAEAYQNVRLRYTAEEFGNLPLDQLISEVREEVERLKSIRRDPKTTWPTGAWCTALRTHPQLG